MRVHKNGRMKAIGIFHRLMYPAFIGCLALHAVTAGSQEIVLTDAANVGMSTDRLQGVSSWIASVSSVTVYITVHQMLFIS